MPSELQFSPSDARSLAGEASVAGRSLQVAQECASRGWPVLPLAKGRKTPAGNCEQCRRPGHSHNSCTCPSEGRWCHSFHAATLDRDRISQWWGARPELGVGVACGPAGLVVIDIDAHHAPVPARDRILPGIHIAEHIDLTGLASGFHTLAVLAALRSRPNPATDRSTLRVRTPSGGLHVWYRTDPAIGWRCSTGSGRARALAWQVDIRAHGGYIVAPTPRRPPAPTPRSQGPSRRRNCPCGWQPNSSGPDTAPHLQCPLPALSLHGRSKRSSPPAAAATTFKAPSPQRSPTSRPAAVFRRGRASPTGSTAPPTPWEV